MSKTVLVVAAHPDDEVLGCGGTIAAHRLKGDQVHVAILAQGLASRGEVDEAERARLHQAARDAQTILGAASLSLFDFPDNRLDSIDLLDLVKVVEGLLARHRPSIVYTHFADDLNIDHRRTYQAVMTACRPLEGSSVESLLCFEVPSSTEWSNCPFTPNWYVDISGTLEKKVRALEAYAGEMRPFPHPRSIEGTKHLAAWRGATAGFMAAEAFVLARKRCVI